MTFAPRVVNAQIGMLSYGDESLREEPVFLKMWPKTKIHHPKLRIDEMRKRCYLRFEQGEADKREHYSILMKFS